MQIDSDAEEETQARTEGEKDRAKDNNQVSVLIFICQDDFIVSYVTIFHITISR